MTMMKALIRAIAADATQFTDLQLQRRIDALRGVTLRSYVDAIEARALIARRRVYTLELRRRGEILHVRYATHVTEYGETRALSRPVRVF